VTVVRMNRGGAVVGADKVTALEARLAIEEALPQSLGNSLRVRPARFAFRRSDSCHA